MQYTLIDFHFLMKHISTFLPYSALKVLLNTQQQRCSKVLDPSLLSRTFPHGKP